jgi:hypothetical protein
MVFKLLFRILYKYSGGNARTRHRILCMDGRGSCLFLTIAIDRCTTFLSIRARDHHLWASLCELGFAVNHMKVSNCP